MNTLFSHKYNFDRMKKINLFIILVLILNFRLSFGQKITPEKLGFKAYSIENDSLGTINYYVSNADSNLQKPVLLYLDGSGASSLFKYVQGGLQSTFIGDYEKLSQSYRIILISKPGVPFFDSVSVDPDFEYLYPTPPPEEYEKRLSLEWRVYSAQLAFKSSYADLQC